MNKFWEEEGGRFCIHWPEGRLPENSPVFELIRLFLDISPLRNHGKNFSSLLFSNYYFKCFVAELDECQLDSLCVYIFFINLILSCILGLEFVYFAIKLLEILKEITWRGWNKYGYYDLIIDLVGVLMSRSKRNCLFFVAHVAIQIVYCGNRKKISRMVIRLIKFSR